VSQCVKTLNERIDDFLLLFLYRRGMAVEKGSTKMKKKPNDFQILNVSNYIRYNNIGTRRHTQIEMGVVLIKIGFFFFFPY
jgi:hypothetical protein